MNLKWLTTKPTVQTGITFGAALAMVISYSRSHSILFAMLHGLMSWIYVAYAGLTQARF